MNHYSEELAQLKSNEPHEKLAAMKLDVPRRRTEELTSGDSAMVSSRHARPDSDGQRFAASRVMSKSHSEFIFGVDPKVVASQKVRFDSSIHLSHEIPYIDDN